MNLREQTQKYGEAVATSPLQKCRVLGFDVPNDLEALAILRGCNYYQKDARELSEELPQKALSNAELAVALLSPHLPTTHRLIRIGAMLLSAPDVDPNDLVALARAESCEGVLRYIAEAGKKYEPHQAFWNAMLDLLRDVRPEGDHLPHPTRFIEMTGVTRGQVGFFTRWLRAQPLNQ